MAKLSQIYLYRLFSFRYINRVPVLNFKTLKVIRHSNRPGFISI